MPQWHPDPVDASHLPSFSLFGSRYVQVPLAARQMGDALPFRTSSANEEAPGAHLSVQNKQDRPRAQVTSDAKAMSLAHTVTGNCGKELRLERDTQLLTRPPRSPSSSHTLQSHVLGEEQHAPGGTMVTELKQLRHRAERRARARQLSSSHGMHPHPLALLAAFTGLSFSTSLCQDIAL